MVFETGSFSLRQQTLLLQLGNHGDHIHLALLGHDAFGCCNDLVDVVRGDVPEETRRRYATTLGRLVGLDAALVVPSLAWAASGVDPGAFGSTWRLEAKKPVRVLALSVMAVIDVNFDGLVGVERHSDIYIPRQQGLLYDGVMPQWNSKKKEYTRWLVNLGDFRPHI